MFFITKLNKHLKILSLIFLFLITIPFQTVVPGRPIFHINVLPAALVYMIIGYGTSQLFKIRNNKIHFSFGILLVFVGWFMSRTYGGNIAQIGSLYYYFESICTILGFLVIANNLDRIKILEYFGKRSLFILGLHSLVLPQATVFAEYMKQSIEFDSDFIYHILIVSVTIVICCSIADVYNNIFKNIQKHLKIRGEHTERV